MKKRKERACRNLELKRVAASVLMICMLVFLCFPAASAWAASSASGDGTAAKTVRVGYYYDTQYMYKTDVDEYRGYDIEYLYKISDFTGWKYKYVDFDSFDDCMAALKEGKIDVVPAVFYSKSRAADMLFSNKKMCDIYVTLTVRNDNTKYAYGDIDSMQGMTVAVLKNSEDGKAFRKWCKANNLNVHIVEMGTTEEITRAIDDGKVDGAGITYLGKSSKYKVIAEFSPSPLYFAVAKDSSDIKNELDGAVDRMMISDPSFSSDIYEKYLGAASGEVPVLTTAEKEYLANKKTIKVALAYDDAPYSYLNSNNSMGGIIPELFNKYADIIPVKFEYIPVKSQQEAITYVQQGRADLVGRFCYDIFAGEDNGLRVTNAYTTINMARIKKHGAGEVQVVGILEDDTLTAFMNVENQTGFQHIRIQTYATVAKCFRALDTGKIDAMYCSISTATYLMGQNKADDYSVNTLSEFTHGICAAASDDEDTRLLDIMNKCIRYTDVGVVDEIIMSNVNKNETTLKSFINNIPNSYLTSILMAMLAILLILIAALISMIKHRKEEKKLAEEREETQRLQAVLSANEQANEARAAFLSTVSHDMRTPLNGIIGFTDLAMESQNKSETGDYLQKIKYSSGLLLDLINDTLDIAKIQNGKYILNLTEVKMGEMLETVEIPVRAAAERKGVEFVMTKADISDDIIKADRTNVQKILLNLLSNAVKFTHRGGNVEFSVTRLDAGEEIRRYRFRIRDTGVGISSEFIPKIYEPFAQESVRDPGSETGTGLGLSIVKQLVDMMDGTIDVASTPGKGTEFVIELAFPVAHSAAVETQTADSIVSDVDLSGMRIMICEDNRLNMEIISALLKKKGAAVIWAKNGEEGVELFLGSKPESIDLILMDIRMPVMGGIEAAQKIRALNRKDAETVPIIAVTADAYEIDKEKCMTVGMNGHLVKPVDPERLYAIIAGFRKSN